RQRRTDLAPDLGPVDAARLVREAYTAEPMPVRLTAQGVVVDSFASGVEVAQPLITVAMAMARVQTTGRFMATRKRDKTIAKVSASPSWRLW
ncbi:MAG TPA: hypothetical protein PKV60_03520, partial [Thermomonas sp.]|nr:hypothetical protein [Thermomonas sp.]